MYLMGDSGLQPRFFTRCLCKAWPDQRDVQDAQVLEQNAAAETQGLNNKVVEEVIGRRGDVGGQKSGNADWVVDDQRHDLDNA